MNWVFQKVTNRVAAFTLKLYIAGPESPGYFKYMHICSRLCDLYLTCFHQMFPSEASHSAELIWMPGSTLSLFLFQLAFQSVPSCNHPLQVAPAVHRACHPLHFGKAPCHNWQCTKALMRKIRCQSDSSHVK